MTTGTTTTGTTTEPRPRGWSQVSVRTRITLVIAVLTTVSMSASGVLVYALESARIERQVHQQIDQEILEFRELQQRGQDPETGEPFDDVERLLTTFLERNIPDDDEMLVAYTSGAPQNRTRNRYGQEVLDEAAYQSAIAALRDEGGTRKFRSAQFGEVWVTVVPVRNNRTQGLLAIINFLDDEHIELNRTMGTYAIVALLSLGLITLLAGLQSGRLLAPLRTLRETASDISTTDLSRRIPEVGNDDITALTHTINVMLDRLEAGFEAQRQFLDDAGHELKTPLTVLGGHLELIDPSSPDEVAETRALLLDEVDRMTRLVSDLILLAKSRRPDFLAPRAVGLAQLTHTVLAKARALGQRDWRLDATGDAVVEMDEQRITQALLQLADNAVKHTSDGDSIWVGSSYDGRVVTLWVRDPGHGVAPADRAQIFERFGRSNVRAGDEGFGLGLSIVRAIAEAHGGSATVEDATPRGSRFLITFPTRPASAKESPWPAS
ncbi:HAMP domain-containing sensor histidine kinase [Nocardioides sp.]|uniref:sensor histidine kinase n=1 Tax=Nocardioides sp. TaxID=35761 RepID=UPI002737591E|nr:HAMP domain-containing sensor histidine kinase [Nocardioides sp.]MDP3894500.1 HAMP domain-containing sensor histidine kinase [Nocardioides sp.]